MRRQLPRVGSVVKSKRTGKEAIVRKCRAKLESGQFVHYAQVDVDGREYEVPLDSLEYEKDEPQPVETKVEPVQPKRSIEFTIGQRVAVYQFTPVEPVHSQINNWLRNPWILPELGRFNKIKLWGSMPIVVMAEAEDPDWIIITSDHFPDEVRSTGVVVPKTHVEPLEIDPNDTQVVKPNQPLFTGKKQATEKTKGEAVELSDDDTHLIDLCHWFLGLESMPETPIDLKPYCTIESPEYFDRLRGEVVWAIDWSKGLQSKPHPRQKTGALVDDLQLLKAIVESSVSN